MIKVGMVSLGCSKNQVDAERLLALLPKGEFAVCPAPGQGQVVSVNTCGFIEDAKQESIDTILEFAALKERGDLRCLVVTGCLAQRYREELAREIPEADVVLGIGRNGEIAAAIRNALEGNRVLAFGPKEDLSLEGDRVLAGPPYSAYVKVAEGCSNRCSYCAIPLIRGDFRSRPLENILEEVRSLAARGIKEVNLVAQDTSRYGLDLYGAYRLPELIHQVCAVEGIHWVRILYCYPDRITGELIAAMAAEPKVCNYIDIPVQHGSGKVLREMNRQGDRRSILDVVRRLREGIPGVAIRTTMIAGFPGETEEDFAELQALVADAKFDRLGCFAYSQEEDTPAGEREDQLPEELRRHRADLIMEQQAPIAFAIAQSQVGRTMEVLVEGKKGGQYYGRCYMDAPDIDTKVFFTSRTQCRPGDFVPVRITAALEYDLAGEAVEGGAD